MYFRARSLETVDQRPIVLDTNVYDSATRNEINSEFAKTITSQGIGSELLGMALNRLPFSRGTYRLEIRKPTIEKSELMGGSNGETIYSYDIVDTGIPSETCKVICSLCNFSNSRIENVLFHCEIDHKQYYCQNKRCQFGFSSWDSLMRHMKNVHRKERE